MFIPLVVRLVANPKQVGVTVSHDLRDEEEKGVKKLVPIIGVAWFDVRTPAICYHSSTELEWLDFFKASDYEDDEEEEIPVAEVTSEEPVEVSDEENLQG